MSEERCELSMTMSGDFEHGVSDLTQAHHTINRHTRTLKDAGSL